MVRVRDVTPISDIIMSSLPHAQCLEQTFSLKAYDVVFASRCKLWYIFALEIVPAKLAMSSSNVKWELASRS